MSTSRRSCAAALALLTWGAPVAAESPLRGTGDLGIVVERAAGTLKLVETTGNTVLGTIEGLGDLGFFAHLPNRLAANAVALGISLLNAL